MFAVTAARIDADDPLAGPAAAVLVQGAAGGVATALIVLGRAAGYGSGSTSSWSRWARPPDRHRA